MIHFPEDFIWGAATAAYQIEGGSELRGTSIWDTFTHTPGNIKDGKTGDTACDHYNRYSEDVKHMADMGIKAYRFSISWPRIFPEGCGRTNPDGIAFYDRLIDLLLEYGITPFITLYHWDLPQSLQDKGGWHNRDTALQFADYSATIFNKYADRVNNWVTLNEPWVAMNYGGIEGIHAPGIKNFSWAFQASHNMMLGHALAVKAYRETVTKKGEIGIVLNLHPCHPNTDSEKDKTAAVLFDGFLNRWYLDLVFTGEYPEDMMALYTEKSCAPVTSSEDHQLFKNNPVDFLGINYYFRFIVEHSETSFLGFEEVPPTGKDVTISGWKPYPQGLLEILQRIHDYYKTQKIYITENGIAQEEVRHTDHAIQDDYRIEYISNHLNECHKALSAGIPLRGYFIWSLLDNFEWADGYKARYGLIHTDHKTFKRKWKQSAYWYKKVIENNGLMAPVQIQ